MTDLSHSREKDKINPVVFYTSAGLILLFSLTTILFRDFSALWIGRTLDWVSKTFGWYYLLAATLYIVFVVCIACSRFGSVKLGPEQSKPEFITDVVLITRDNFKEELEKKGLGGK